MAITAFQRLISSSSTVFVGADRDQAAFQAANGAGDHPDAVSRFPFWMSIEKYDNDTTTQNFSPFGDTPNPDFVWILPTTPGQTASFAVASQPITQFGDITFSVFLAAFADNAMKAKIELFEQFPLSPFLKVEGQPLGLDEFLMIAGNPDMPSVGLTEAQPYNWQNLRIYSTVCSFTNSGDIPRKIVVSFEVTNYLISDDSANPAGLQFICDLYQNVQ